MAKGAIFAPFFCELDSALLQIPGVLLEFSFEAFEERNGIGGGACESDDHLVVVETPRFAGVVLHDVIAHGHLTIGDQHYLVVFAHAQNGCAVHLCAFFPVPHPTIIQRGTVGPKATLAAPSLCSPRCSLAQLSSSFSFFFSSLDLRLPTFWKRSSSEALLKRSGGRFELYLQVLKKTWLERRPLRSCAICMAVRTPSIN